MKQNYLKSYSKINLFLNIWNKSKKTKLHNLYSIIFKTDLHDKIKVKKIFKQNDVIIFSGIFSKQVNKSKNSISQSLFILRKKGFLKKNPKYQIKIEKKIPVFSGLGGSSSNASTLIKYFLKRKKISKKNLNYFSNKIGSDLRLFFESNQILQKSLTKYKNLNKKMIFYFIIIYPFFRCSTKEIYSKVNNYDKIKKLNFNNLNSKKKMVQNLKQSHNSLEKIAIKKFPKISKILAELKQLDNCEFSRLTGSGSACFGLFLTKKSAHLGLRKIKKKFPNYWCVVAKSI
tara:strand:- start:431 stop:1291 length:861 start_codon:yes stop_codon:yes gene_type:complete